MALKQWVAGAVFCAAVALSGAAQAQTVEEFYRGKSLNMIIGYPPAGANDAYARMAARHLGKHIPGSPTVVPRNMPGAGSLLAASHIFNIAPKDGTTLGLLVPTLPLDEKLESAAAKYKAAGFNWIGRMAPSPNITFIMSTSQVKTIADAFEKVAVLGATGRSATNSIYPTVLNNVLGTRFKIVNGYEGSASAMIAMERGEVEGHSSTYDSLKAVHPDWITDKRVNIVVQYSLRRHPELPDVPTSVELSRTDEQRALLTAVSSASEIGKFVLTTPDVPADRVTALRRDSTPWSRIRSSSPRRRSCVSSSGPCRARSCKRSFSPFRICGPISLKSSNRCIRRAEHFQEKACPRLDTASRVYPTCCTL